MLFLVPFCSFHCGYGGETGRGSLWYEPRRNRQKVVVVSPAVP